MSDVFVRHFLVHWNDCDPAGIVFHANFVRWMDEGFTELLRARGLNFAEMQRTDPLFRGAPLVDVKCGFRAPARFGDVLEQRIPPPVLGQGRAFRVVHNFHVGEVLIAEGEQTRIWGMAQADGTGLRGVAMPEDAVAKLGAERP